MLSKKIFIVFGLGLLLLVSFFQVTKAAEGTNNGGQTSGMYEVDGDNETKDENFILPGPTGQTYAYNVRSVVVISTDPGSISVEICIVRPDGLVVSCGTPINDVDFGRVQDWATEGEGSMDLNWNGGSYLLIHIRVNSSSHYTTQTTVKAYGRYVDARTLSASPGTVNQGQPTTLYFNPVNNISNISIYDLTHSNFDWQVLPDETQADTEPINEDTTFAIMVKGPCPDGQDGECISDSNHVTVRVAKATVACVVHQSTINGPPISGATCNIAGQSGTTNGDGYRAFNNVGQGNQTLTVTANGYNSYSETRNITGNYDWHVALTQSCAGNMGQSCSATSNANACGQRSTNTGTYQCNGDCSVGTPNPPPTPVPTTCNATNACGQTATSTATCGNTCSVSPPANPAYYGQACTGATSSPNSCGDTNAGGAGTYGCAGNTSSSNCSGATGSTPAQRANYGSACSAVASAPNVCGMIDYGTNGTYVCNGGANSGGGTSCSAVNGVTPANNLCPAPSVSITANGSGGPVTVPWNSNVTIAWVSVNASSCTITPPGWTGLSGSQTTGNIVIPGTYVYTATCSGNGSVAVNEFVTVSPPIPSAYSATYSEPDYCTSGPGGYVAWSYDAGPSGSPQASYEIQITNVGNFNNPFYDSGQLNSSSHVFSIPNGVLQFGMGYKARVRTWNSWGGVSAWSSPTNNFNTPPYAYPDVIPPYQFTWPALPKPQQNKEIQFTDHTLFGGGNVNNRQWSWVFGDGATSTQQSPAHTFTTIGNYTISQTVTDAANQTCSYSQSINVQKPIPVIKEVAPR